MHLLFPLFLLYLMLLFTSSLYLLTPCCLHPEQQSSEKRTALGLPPELWFDIKLPIYACFLLLPFTNKLCLCPILVQFLWSPCTKFLQHQYAAACLVFFYDLHTPHLHFFLTMAKTCNTPLPMGSSKPLAFSLAAVAMVDNMEGVERIPVAPKWNLNDVLGKVSTPMTIKPCSNSIFAPAQPLPPGDHMDMDVDDPNAPFVEDPPTAPASSPAPQKAINFALAFPFNMIPSPAPRNCLISCL